MLSHSVLGSLSGGAPHPFVACTLHAGENKAGAALISHQLLGKNTDRLI